MSSTPVLAGPSRDNEAALASTCGGNTNAPLTFGAAQGYIQVPGAAVMIDAGSDLRNVVTTFSIDANVAPGAEMRSTFTVDGGAPGDYAYGPGNLAENQQFSGNRTIMNVIPLGEGTHTIKAWVRINYGPNPGAPNITGQLGRFCLVAEGSTGS